MRLHDGTLWPLPITLDVTDDVADKVQAGSKLALRHPEGIMLAVLHIEDKWKADKKNEAKNVLGSVNAEHPGVRYLMNDSHPWYLGGKIEGIQLPEHLYPPRRGQRGTGIAQYFRDRAPGPAGRRQRDTGLVYLCRCCRRA